MTKDTKTAQITPETTWQHPRNHQNILATTLKHAKKNHSQLPYQQHSNAPSNHPEHTSNCNAMHNTKNDLAMT